MREYIERLLTDGAAVVLELERERLELRNRYRETLLTPGAASLLGPELLELLHEQRALQGRIDELRRLLDAVRRQHTVDRASRLAPRERSRQ